MRWWPPWRRAPDRSVEARAELEKLVRRDDEIDALGRELRTAQRRNNFSGMVAAAIARSAHEGR